MSISQPPAQGRGKSGAKAGAGPGRPPSTNGRKGAQNGQRSVEGRTAAKSPGTNRQPAQRNDSMKTAGNRQVSAKTATQRTASRPGDRQK